MASFLSCWIFKTFVLHLINNNTTMTTEQTIADAIKDFVKRWGVQPNGILINPRLYIRSSLPCSGAMEFEGIPIFRSPDIDEHKVRFVL